jgi:hypothetical protein
MQETRTATATACIQTLFPILGEDELWESPREFE